MPNIFSELRFHRRFRKQVSGAARALPSHRAAVTAVAAGDRFPRETQCSAPLASRLPLALLLAMGAAVLTGCGRSAEEKNVTQVAAKVNRDEITVHQINQALTRLGSIPESQQKQAQQQVLERLIDQQLLIQQAVQRKLDRDPRVLGAIEAAKRQLLAQAYLEQAGKAGLSVTPHDVEEFYAQNLGLFQHRRIYRLREIGLSAPPEFKAQLRAELDRLDKLKDKSKVIPELANWLQSQNVKFTMNTTTQATEMLPSEVIDRIQKLKDGDLLLLPRGNTFVVSQIERSEPAPLTREQAAHDIEQFLESRKKAEFSSQEVKRLRAAATVEYIGEFASKEAAAPAAASAPAALPAVPATPATSPQGVAGLAK